MPCDTLLFKKSFPNMPLIAGRVSSLPFDARLVSPGLKLKFPSQWPSQWLGYIFFESGCRTVVFLSGYHVDDFFPRRRCER